MALIDDVSGAPVALDTAPLIYFFEGHQRFGPVVRPLLAAAAEGTLELFTSALTLLELVVPYRVGASSLADRYDAALTRGRGLTMTALDAPVLRAAALLRARHRVATADAIQLASALTSGCRTFVTNGRRLPELPTLRVLQLADYVTR